MLKAYLIESLSKAINKIAKSRWILTDEYLIANQLRDLSTAQLESISDNKAIERWITA